MHRGLISVFGDLMLELDRLYMLIISPLCHTKLQFQAIHHILTTVRHKVQIRAYFQDIAAL